jgi:arylsulfatase A-like enzyme
LTGVQLAAGDAPDSFNVLPALLGTSKVGRDHFVEQAGALSLIQGEWKYIEPNKGARIEKNTNIELGNDFQPQLYNLAEDIGEKRNLAALYPKKVEEMADLLKKVREQGRTR